MSSDLVNSQPIHMLALLLGRLERLNDEVVSDACKPLRLSPSGLRVLAMLRGRGVGTPASPSEIGRWIVQTSGGLTATLRRLEAEGYVDRADDPSDGRGRLVMLTSTGAEVYRGTLENLIARYATAFADLDLDAAVDVASRLVGGLERSAGLDEVDRSDLLLRAMDHKPPITTATSNNAEARS